MQPFAPCSHAAIRSMQPCSHAAIRSMRPKHAYKHISVLEPWATILKNCPHSVFCRLQVSSQGVSAEYQLMMAAVFFLLGRFVPSGLVVGWLGGWDDRGFSAKYQQWTWISIGQLGRISPRSLVPGSTLYLPDLKYPDQPDISDLLVCLPGFSDILDLFAVSDLPDLI